MANVPSDKRPGSLSEYIPLIQAADGLTLSQVCALSDLEPSTVQNWVKRGFVPHPVRKKYRERHLARILLIAQLRESMPIDRVGELLHYINGDTDDESDDIITEEHLYDLFRDVTAALTAADPTPGEIDAIVDDQVRQGLGDDTQQEKISGAMRVMACAYISANFKQKADQLFADLIGSEQE